MSKLIEHADRGPGLPVYLRVSIHTLHEWFEVPTTAELDPAIPGGNKQPCSSWEVVPPAGCSRLLPQCQQGLTSGIAGGAAGCHGGGVTA